MRTVWPKRIVRSLRYRAHGRDWPTNCIFLPAAFLRDALSIRNDVLTAIRGTVQLLRAIAEQRTAIDKEHARTSRGRMFRLCCFRC